MYFNIFFDVNGKTISLSYDNNTVNFRKVIYDAFDEYMRLNNKHDIFNQSLENKINFIKCGFFKHSTKSYNFMETDFMLDYNKYNIDVFDT